MTEWGDGNNKITAGVAPETSTPMPPCLWYIYETHLGWPGRPEDYKPLPALKVDPALALQRWRNA